MDKSTFYGRGLNSSSPYGTPLNFVVTVLSQTSMYLTWTGGTGKVERSTDGINFTQIGTGTNSFLDENCVSGNIYYYRIKGSVYSNIEAGTYFVTDVDGNRYPQTTIGTQKWLTKNLKTTKYRDGTAIPTDLSNANWALEDGSAGRDGAYAQVNGDVANKMAYGLLYNWHCLNNAKGLAPTGSHVHTKTEADTLMTTLGGVGLAGGKLKETLLAHWDTPNTGAVNTSKFKGVGAGNKNATLGTYASFKAYGIYHTATAFDATKSYRFYMDKASDNTVVDSDLKGYGSSVRCISDIVSVEGNRFADNFLENICGAWSVSYGEPTALVSSDGNQIDLWFYGTVGANTCIHYTYSIDGLTFAEPVPTNIPTGYLRNHAILFKGVYYHYASQSDNTIHLFTGTDKIHYVDQGVVLSKGAAGTWDDAGVSNTFVWQENDGANWFMFYDGYDGAIPFRQGLATASAPEGPWTKYASNPIFPGYLDCDGNFEMPRVNNEVIKHNGLYYVYYMHGNFTNGANINRAYSSDLHTWVDEGEIFDVRKIHGLGLSYGDQCMVQFKGKSYMFDNVSDQSSIAHIDCAIDNRPLIAMLALTP
jgi:uncharacterized protein (TIGR02145 family)